jgi:tetratricopeptide (TPR) repeat protein
MDRVIVAVVTSASVALAAPLAHAQKPAAGGTAMWLLDTTAFAVENGCTDALPKLEAVLRKRPDDHAAWLQLARCHGEAKAPEKRLAAHQAAWKLRPGDVQDAYLVAWSLEDMGRWQAALDGYDSALALDPRHAKSILGRGVTLYHLRRNAEALPVLNDALRQLPGDSRVLLHRALVLEKLGRLDEALADLYRVIRPHPDQA